MILDNLNHLTLAIFAPILVLVGLLGFVIPPDKSLTSGAAPYNIFHIVFGIIGAMVVLFNSPAGIKIFNLGFGLIDLYQALASLMGWFPRGAFKWKRADDVLHIVVGAALVLIGIFGS